MSGAEHARLNELFRELNETCFGGVLPLLPLRFAGRLKSSGGAYRRGREGRRIDINPRYLSMRDGWVEIRDTLGHEMIHYWLDFSGRPCGHTPEFRRKLREHGWSRYSRLPPVGTRYVYRCVNCLRTFHRKRQATLACGPCSGRRFNPLYRLELVER